MLVLFYGLYLGVLSRDCAEVCADRMASSMGVGTARSATVLTSECTYSLALTHRASRSSTHRKPETAWRP